MRLRVSSLETDVRNAGFPRQPACGLDQQRGDIDAHGQARVACATCEIERRLFGTCRADRARRRAEVRSIARSIRITSPEDRQDRPASFARLWMIVSLGWWLCPARLAW